MRLIIGSVGKLKDGPERDIFSRYGERIGPAGRPLNIGPFSQFEIAEAKARSAEERKEREAQGLLAKLPDGARLIALDEKGKSFTTEKFAAHLRQQREAGQGCLAFFIGGADGHGPAVLQRADMTLSLSPMTLPHGLARIVLAEQLYRALTLLSGHPYHRA